MDRYISYAIILFITGIMSGYYMAMTNTKEVLAVFQEVLKDLTGLGDLGPVTLFLVVFFNNSAKTLFMMATGLFFSIIPALFIFFNGFLLGVISFLSIQQVGIFPLLLGILPHGIIEIPTMILAGAYGLWLGTCSMRKFLHKEPLYPNIMSALHTYLYLFVPLLFVAALVEVFITGYLLKTFL